MDWPTKYDLNNYNFQYDFKPVDWEGILFNKSN